MVNPVLSIDLKTITVTDIERLSIKSTNVMVNREYYQEQQALKSVEQTILPNWRGSLVNPLLQINLYYYKKKDLPDFRVHLCKEINYNKVNNVNIFIFEK